MKEEFYMEFALRLAAAAQGQTAPNPVVGAVIVKDGEIVGYGSHLKAGEPHAEVHALHMAGSKAEGSTLFVTLEPCAHHGKTPPCAEAIIQAGVKEVIIASVDRNPLVENKGIARLQEAGIVVKTGVLQAQADRLNIPFFHFIKTKKPFVTLKQAITLDGKTATKTGHSKWITGAEARRDVHNERGKHDAILVGIGTVLADDPTLTNREGETLKQPIRIVLDTHCRTPLDSKVAVDTSCPTWIITGSQAETKRTEAFTQEHVTVIKLPQASIEVEDVLRLLGERGITSLYVEGGQTVNASFLKSGNVNQLITYIAPKLVGGMDAPGICADLAVTHMEQSHQLVFEKIEQLGQDIKITSKVKAGEKDVYRNR